MDMSFMLPFFCLVVVKVVKKYYKQVGKIRIFTRNREYLWYKYIGKKF
jgi:hypothetical protein